MGMTNFEFFAIIVFCMAVLGGFSWRQIKRNRDAEEADLAKREKRALEISEDMRRIRNKAEEALKRSQNAADAYNEAASMEPFCGEGKKP